MSQNDMSMANASGAAFRADVNSALQALVTNNSGATAPATTFAYMWWADTTAGILKQRNAANSAWLDVLTLSTGRPTGVAASGANSDITSLTALGAGGLPDNSVTTPDIANAAVTPAKLSQPFTSGAAVPTTSGTAIDLTGIPSWANRVTLTMRGCTFAGSNNFLVQPGAGAPQTSGYSNLSNYIASAGTVSQHVSTAGHLVTSLGSGVVNNSVITMVRQTGNSWLITHIGMSGGYGLSGISTITLPGALDRVRLTSDGSSTFNAGSVNIIYE